MIDVETRAVIRRPRAEVSAFAADPSNAPLWYEKIRSVEWQTEPPLRVGSRVAFVARFLGKTLAYTYEVTSWVPGEELVMRTAEGPFPMETTYAFMDGEGGSTWMRLRNRGRPAGFSRLLAPFLSIAVRSANRKDLARLTALLESRSDGGPASTRSP